MHIQLSRKKQQLRPNHSLPLIALGLLAGVCLLQLQPVIQLPLLSDNTASVLAWQGPIWTVSETLFLLPIALWFFYTSSHRRLILSVLIGYLWALLFAQITLQHQLPEALIGQDILIEGVISGLPVKNNRSVRFEFAVQRYHLTEKIDSKIKQFQTSRLPLHIRLSWYYYRGKLNPGEHWQLLVRLKPPHGIQNTGGFDYEKWLYQHNITATGYVRKSLRNKASGKINYNINTIREKIRSVLTRSPDKTYQGLLQALTIGEKSAINQQQWLVLRKTGTSHLMAISGLHIGLIAGFVFFLVRQLVPAFMCHILAASQIAAIVSLLFAGFYAALAGFSVPTQRAFIMLFVVMLAIIARRPALNVNTLSVALILILMVNPNSVLSAGFWLSFFAVIIIGFVSTSRIKFQQNKVSRWQQGLKIQWFIAIGMLPLSIVMFNQGSLVSPLANMLVIPLIGLLVVPLALLASFISFISIDSAIFLFTQISSLFDWIWSLLEMLSKIPYASWSFPAISLLQGLMAILGGMLLLTPKGFPLRYSGLILIIPMMLFKPPRPESGEFWVDVIDVGQGLSVLIRTTEKTLLYDTGAKYSSHFDMGRQAIMPYLGSIGVVQLDKLIISHGDNDHDGGTESLLEMIEAEQIIAEQQVFVKRQRPSRPDKLCQQGMSWQWNGVHFEILHPNKDRNPHYKKLNNRSCVLKIHNKDYSLLLVGDIEAKAERDLLQQTGVDLQADILLVPHHGSNTSSSKAWLNEVMPKVAIVSSGYKNRFRHPTNRVMARYHALESCVLNTANTGMIQIKVVKKSAVEPIKFRLQRKINRHYWHHRLDNVSCGTSKTSRMH